MASLKAIFNFLRAAYATSARSRVHVAFALRPVPAQWNGMASMLARKELPDKKQVDEFDMNHKMVKSRRDDVVVLNTLTFEHWLRMKSVPRPENRMSMIRVRV
ncbi:hypothetical protein BSKO_07107 [Bryopsis sp. KO-2023]|nr:hypothetical protein BSKO_07107 [Bryopsis sp. KO-2023]